MDEFFHQLYSIEAEEAVIGAVLIDVTAYTKIADTLKPDYFYNPGLGLIYQTMQEMFKKDVPTDVVTLPDELRTQGLLDKAGGIDYVLLLAANISTTTNVEYYSNIIRDKYQRRKILRHGRELQSPDIATETMDTLIQQYDKFKAEILDLTPKDQTQCFGDRLMKALGEEPPERLFTTGIRDLDDSIFFEKQKLMILAGNTGIGKTSLALNLALHASKNGQKVLFNCLEMRECDVLNRIVAIHNQVPIYKVKQDRATYYGKTLSLDNLYFDYYRLYTIESIARQCLILKPDFLIVDHNMRLRTDVDPQKNETQHHRRIASGLLEIAQQQNICVLLNCHFNRDKTGGKEPTNLNLYGSIAYEQDADTVMLLYLPDENNPGDVVMKVTKNRNDFREKINMKFVPESTIFKDPREKNGN